MPSDATAKKMAGNVVLWFIELVPDLQCGSEMTRLFATSRWDIALLEAARQIDNR